MEESFDPYLQWLGIRGKSRPPNHYRLLGIDLFEPDLDVISGAADRQMAYVRGFQTGQRAELSQKILNELSAARLCLLKVETKAAYDARLRDQLAARHAHPAAPPAAPPPTAAITAGAAAAPAVATLARPAAEAGLGQLDFAADYESHGRRRARRRESSSLPLLVIAGLVVVVAVAGIVWQQNQASTEEDSRPVASADSTAQAAADKANTDGSTEVASAASNRQPSSTGERDNAATPNETPAATDDGDGQKPAEAARSAEIDKLLGEVRRQLALRNVEDAVASLRSATGATVSAEQRAELECLLQLAGHLRSFWDGVRRGVSLVMPGDQLMVDGQLLVVLSTGNELMTNRMSDGVDETWPLELNLIHPQLAAVLAERSWNAASGSSLVAVGAFWAMDRGANRELARELWLRAGSEGARIETLLPELEIPLADVPAPEKPDRIASSNAGANRVPGSVSDKRAQRIAAPSDAEITAALSEARAKYRQELSGASDSEGRTALATALSQLAENASREPATQFALWKLAEELAVNAEDLDLALGIIARRGERFEIDAVQPQYDLLSSAFAKSRGPVSSELLLSALTAASAAADAERFDLAIKLAQMTKAQAAKAKNKSLEKEAIGRDRQIKDLQKTFDAAQKALARLESEPENPRDNATVGRFYCFVKHDWDRGLKMLAKGGDDKAAKAASLELATPATAEAQAEVADAWWASGESPAAVNRLPILKRAQYWYEQCKESLSTVERARVEKRLSAIADAAGKSQGSGLGELLELTLGPSAKLRFRQIPAGKFQMGSPASERGHRDEETLHAVTITRPFYLGITEVTQAQWLAVMGSNPSSFKGRDLPVETVTWFDCTQFCQRLNQSRLGSRYQFRLPTEAEWEYACRAGARSAYCFGDASADLADYGWYVDNSSGQTHPVAQRKPNAWGLYDMHGNVVEWCQDSRVPFSSAAQADPLVTDAGFGRINRGGSAWQDATYLRSASRGSNPQEERRRYLGLRVVAVPR